MYHQTFPNHLNSPATISGAYIKPVTDNIYILPNHLKNPEKISVFVMPTSTYTTKSLKSSLINLISSFKSSLVAKEVRSFSDICLSCFYQWNIVLKVKTITPATIEYRHLLISLFTSFKSLSNLFRSPLTPLISSFVINSSLLRSSFVAKLHNDLSNALAWLKDCSSDKPDFLKSSKYSHDVSVAIYLSSLSVVSPVGFFVRNFINFFFYPLNYIFIFLKQVMFQLFYPRFWYSSGKHNIGVFYVFCRFVLHRSISFFNNIFLVYNLSRVLEKYSSHILDKLYTCIVQIKSKSRCVNPLQSTHRSQLNLNRRFNHV